MFRAQTTPTANPYLSRKWDMIEYETHRYNVRNMKSRLDTKPPRIFTSTFIKPNKLQFELERFSTIQRDNANLLNRLATIHRHGGWIDNKNYHEVKSLNTTSRQKEMVNLTYANKIMLERINDTHTNYNKSKLEAEHLLQQKHKAIARKFAENWREIRDQIKEEKAEVRRKYIYPRVGFPVKNGTKSKKFMQFGDGRDSKRPTENSASTETEPKSSSKYKKPSRKHATILTEKGENVGNNKIPHQGVNKPYSKKGTSNSESLKKEQNVTNAAFKKTEKQIPESGTKINASPENMVQESAVDRIPERTSNGEDSDLKEEKREIPYNK